jgi:mycothiol synthase
MHLRGNHFAISEESGQVERRLAQVLNCQRMAVIVSPASVAEWPTAGRILFAAGEDPGRATAKFLALIASGDIDPSGVFVARGRNGVYGAMLAQPFAGGQAAVWPPVVTDEPDREQIEHALAVAALGWLRASGVKVAQAVLHPGERGVPALLRAGFVRVTELAFLCWETSSFFSVCGKRGQRGENMTFGQSVFAPHREKQQQPSFSITPYSSANASAFADTLLASYDGTLDCPELNGTRSADEIIAGYRETTPGGPREWFLAYVDNSPVAVLLLSGPPTGAWTLTYLGVVPFVRGQGIGRSLTRFAMSRAAAASAPGMTLNVDVRNEPARRLYAAEGFVEYDRREVYLALW